LSARHLAALGGFSAFQLVVWEPAHKRRTYRRKQRFLIRCCARPEMLKC
jgi:hypothetical protein